MNKKELLGEVIKGLGEGVMLMDFGFMAKAVLDGDKFPLGIYGCAGVIALLGLILVLQGERLKAV